MELEEFEDYEFEGLPRTEANLDWLAAHLACQRCGACCRRHQEGLRLSCAEAARLAARAGLTRAAFLATLQATPTDYVMAQPCRYLAGSACRVHDIKPDVCRRYPLHHASVRGVPTRWVVITACPAGRELIRLVLSGRQAGLEYSS